jgi:osmotically-inducible protein OsmY
VSVRTEDRTTAPRSVAADIRAAWDDTQDLDASAISVTVDIGGNSIELHGDVGSYADRLTALVAAMGHAPLMQVRNLIVVRERPGSDLLDADIAAGVRTAIEPIGLAPVGPVTVRDHVVTLHGTVPDVATRIAVHGATARTAGVDFVDDRIVVRSTHARSIVD